MFHNGPNYDSYFEPAFQEEVFCHQCLHWDDGYCNFYYKVVLPEDYCEEWEDKYDPAY